MMLSLVLISMLVGGTAAIFSLVSSGSIVLALVVFMSAGSLAVFVLAAVIFLIDYLGRRIANVSGRPMGAWSPHNAADHKA